MTKNYNLLLRFTFFVLTFSVTQLTYAQLHNNGQLITIGADAILTSEGNVVNDGVITNNGRLVLRGDWRNNQTYNAGTGVMIINGVGLQTLAHNQQDIYTLELDGAGNKVLTDSLRITKLLNLKEGILVTSTKLIVLENNADVDGGNDASYVQGGMWRKGVGYKLFPVGLDNQYLPVELENVSGNDETATGIRLGKTFSGALPEYPEEIREVYSDYFWNIRARGTFEGSPLRISHPDVLLDPDRLLLAQLTDNRQTLNVVRVSTSDSGSDNYRTIQSLGAVATGTLLVARGGETDRAIPVTMSNVLSPRAPNEADRSIMIFGDDIIADNFSFLIFDNWGNKVFETNDLQKMQEVGWTGKNQNTGNLMMAGEYRYVMIYTSLNGNKQKKTGKLLMIN